MQTDPIAGLGDHFDAFVGQQIEAGRYASAEEVVRAGLRLLEEREARLQVLRRALIEGEESGPTDDSLAALITELDAETQA